MTILGVLMARLPALLPDALALAVTRSLQQVDPGSSFWTAALTQVPSLAIVLVFLIYTQRNQAQANERNHTTWQSWLTQREEASKGERAATLIWMQAQSEREQEERQRWQQWLDAQAQQRVAEQAELVRAMTSVENQLDTTSQVLMMLYATVSGADMEVLRKLMRNGAGEK